MNEQLERELFDISNKVSSSIIDEICADLEESGAYIDRYKNMDTFIWFIFSINDVLYEMKIDRIEKTYMIKSGDKSTTVVNFDEAIKWLVTEQG